MEIPDKHLTGSLIDQTDAIFSQWDSRESPGCALAVIKDGQIAYARGYGMANLEHDIPIAADSIFHVASISKQFTAFCIALLAQEGKLSLDDDIRTYVPSIPDFGQTIAVRHLVHHTSGLRDMWDLLEMAGWCEDDLITFDDMLWVAGRQQSLNFTPGDQWLYSNTGYALLALIVRSVTGKSLRDYADDRIFKPLGMSRTHFHDDHSEIVRGRTQAYQPRDEGGLRVSIPVFDVVGTTSLFTTVEDLFRWEQNFTTKLVGADVFDMTLSPGSLNDGASHDYGFGLRVYDDRGVRVVQHSGSDAGYRAHFMRVPEQRFAVMCLANLSTIETRVLCEKVTELWLADQLAPKPTATTGDHDMEQLAGLYRSPRTGDIVLIRHEDGQLIWGFNVRRVLEPAGPAEFHVTSLPGVRVHFDSPDALTLVGFSTPLPERFERVERSASDSDQLQQIAGRYRSEELDTSYELRVVDGKLILRRHRKEDVELHPAFAGAFADDRWRLEFDCDGTPAAGFTISTTRVRGVRFTRDAGTTS